MNIFFSGEEEEGEAQWLSGSVAQWAINYYIIIIIILIYH